jgi:2-oxoisovalerate dehydrogenase E2 component (dihydrolipoyl transacylase)
MTAERVFAMPDLGEGLEEGEIVAWLVGEGEAVELNQPVVEVETAKATVEIPSPFAGSVVALHGSVGSTVPVGAPLVTFSTSAPRPGDGPAAERDTPAAERATPEAGAPARATPPVRKLAKELGVDLAAVAGSGPGGRITADDVRASSGHGEEGRVVDATRGTAKRAGIAATLQRQAAIPQVTTFRTVDCSALDVFRRELGMSPLPVVIAALCKTIAAHPDINAHWDEDEGVVQREAVHVGVAADTDRGLVVPVVHDASAMSIASLSEEIRRLATAARGGSLVPAELGGATIAVSNTGSYGSEAGTPILSPGTSVTLALGVIAPRALVIDDRVVARPGCTLSCTFDHRVLDGAGVGRALTDLVETLTSADRLGGLPR